MKLQLVPDIEPRLREALRDAGCREIGGMLFAEQLAPGSFKIIDFSLDASSGSYGHFQRDPNAHVDVFNAFFEKTGNDFRRFNYLGEWHSHPLFSVRPSVADEVTMQMLVDGPDSDISFALLMIVRLRFRIFMEYSLTIFARDTKPKRVRLAPAFI
jgi:hypothetical protein